MAITTLPLLLGGSGQTHINKKQFSTLQCTTISELFGTNQDSKGRAGDSVLFLMHHVQAVLAQLARDSRSQVPSV